MAVTTEEISADDLAFRAANKPVTVGSNALKTALRSGDLRANTAGTVAAADGSDTTYGVEFLQDRLLHVPWKFGSSVTDAFIVIDTGAVDGSGLVDALWIKGAASWAGRTVKVEADSTTPTIPWTGATTVFEFVMPAGGDTLKLHASTLHAARYWRIHVSGSAGIFEAREIFLGRAIQFPVKSNYDWVPPSARVAAVNEIVSEKSGVRRSVKTSPGLQERKQRFEIGEAHDGTFLAKLAAFWEDDIDDGTDAFVYCEDPTAAPDKALLVYSNEPKFDLVQVGPFLSRFTLDYTEQGGGG